MSSDHSARATLTIDLSAIQQNYDYMRSLADPRVKHAAVLKSDAYGLGLRPVAEALVEAGCTSFFVANLDEAVALRELFPEVAVNVLDGDCERFAATYERKELTPVLNTADDLDVIRRTSRPPAYVLNIDTGLTRLGLLPADVRRLFLAGTFERWPPVGIMSHLACSAMPDNPLNELQRRRFASLYRILRPGWGSLVASAGLWLGQRYHFDLTRLASALLGLNDPRIRPTPLASVLDLSAPIVHVRDLNEGESAGYGATWRARRRSRIAVVAMGYTHGLPWLSGNRIVAHIAEFTAPVVGRLSMEYLTVDVTDVPEQLCHRGSRVELLNDKTRIDDLADAVGTAAQEVLLRLGAGCQRTYRAAVPLCQRRFREAS